VLSQFFPQALAAFENVIAVLGNVFKAADIGWRFGSGFGEQPHCFLQTGSVAELVIDIHIRFTDFRNHHVSPDDKLMDFGPQFAARSGNFIAPETCQPGFARGLLNAFI
jgi:hypothetical protein